jgi:hypothetical protein
MSFTFAAVLFKKMMRRITLSQPEKRLKPEIV